ncbi:MAG TPA: TIGR03618 family F420-dependent PPOX class oxidoreductase [Candidatus Kryptonia bacterium]|nr:TIGR03618 family F420-dependent PPOX class oxidoreductase [Candidatus Kryptonia bacterium]
MNRRKQIEMSLEERTRFLADAQTIILTSIDHRGYPHAVAMWFAVDPDGSVLMTTYAKSQKTLNLQRNPRVALLVESGATYDQLRGVLIRGRAEVIPDVERCVQVLMRIHQKMGGALQPGIEDAMRAQARKRILIRVVPERVSSWDHSKLGGVY